MLFFNEKDLSPTTRTSNLHWHVFFSQYQSEVGLKLFGMGGFMCKRSYTQALLVYMGTNRPQPLCDWFRSSRCHFLESLVTFCLYPANSSPWTLFWRLLQVRAFVKTDRSWLQCSGCCACHVLQTIRFWTLPSAYLDSQKIHHAWSGTIPNWKGKNLV